MDQGEKSINRVICANNVMEERETEEETHSNPHARYSPLLGTDGLFVSNDRLRSGATKPKQQQDTADTSKTIFASNDCKWSPAVAQRGAHCLWQVKG